MMILDIDIIFRAKDDTGYLCRFEANGRSCEKFFEVT
jgi:hypothetical protein